MYDCVIIGAGVVGAMTARELSKYQLKLCILEKENDVAMGATKANSAIVHAGFDAEPGSLKARLNVKGSEMMPTVTAELGVKYKNNGSLVIGFSEADKAKIQELYARGCANGVKNLQILDSEAVHTLEPNLSQEVTCALYAPTGSIICPYELTVAAIGNAMDNGADLKLNFEVTQIRPIADGYEISSGSEKVLARTVINAAGLFADEIAEMIGDNSFSIHPRKGEYILLDKDCGNLVSHTIFRTPNEMGKGILVSPTVDGNLLTGPTSVDMTDKLSKDTSAEGFDQIIGQAMENIDGIPFRKSITSFCGLRAVGDTGDFIITSPRTGFIHAAGIESPGLSASPAIAEYITNMLKEQGYELEENPDFQPTRKPMHYFREASIEEKNEIIKKDKRFGRIICRCETVTEGEIIEAIRTNPRPRDLDGVKRRTRAQMGRCQGGFCMPYIVNLLSQELQIAPEEVTKSGSGSYINIGKTKEA
ncbi:MAG: NAD(P)/FAD-dependent oxidoreductase [Clostridia bacterium]|nr:NAD(P)/FAD-dependent oxidoreductase [Clostridia bacterium]